MRRPTPPEQAAEYAASTLGILAMCGAPSARQAVRNAVGELPADVLLRFSHLKQHLSAPSSPADGETLRRFGAACAVGWLVEPVRRVAERAARRWRRRCGGGAAAPEDFVCPITLEVMSDPVIASDGHGYERHAIRTVIDTGSALSPLTREQLAADVYPNIRLRQRIAAWRRAETPSGARGLHARARLGLTLVALGATATVAAAAATAALCGEGSHFETVNQ